ncbi:MAG: molybdenum cofactor guanylyltransferase MobA [Burkholderiales bacterium]
MNIQREDITGLVLAGGQGQRMAGLDKGWLMLDGQPLITHALRRLAPQAAKVLISANRELERYRAMGHEVVTDDAATLGTGPLAGVLAAMQVCRTPWLVTVPCDSPHFPLNLVTKLTEAIATANPAPRAATVVTPHSPSHPTHPVFCLLHLSTQTELSVYLESGRRSMQGWLAQVQALQVPFENACAFANINTPQDLEQAQTTASGNAEKTRKKHP